MQDSPAQQDQPQKDQSKLTGELSLANGTTLRLQLAQSHWDQLLVLVENEESEGDIAASIASFIAEPELKEYEPSQLVEWMIDRYVTNIETLVFDNDD